MMRFLGLLLAVGVVALVAYVGCGPRGQVAMDEVTKRLDKALGELNIKRKGIENKQSSLQDQIATLKENLFKAEARLDLIQQKKEKSEVAVKDLQNKIPALKDLIEEVKEQGKITRGGKEYSAEDVQTMADEVAGMIKGEQLKLGSYVTSYNALKGSVDFLRNQEKQSGELMRELQSKISEIDAKKIAVDAVRENTSFASGNESIGKSLESLSKEIEDLGVDVEAALRLETDKMSDLTKSSSMVDELLSTPTDLDSTSKMLDDLLK